MRHENDIVRDAIDGELARQDRMWGNLNQRADISNKQLLRAGAASLDTAMVGPFSATPDIYPKDWSGWRDYGSEFSNLGVAVAFLTQRMRQLVREGESTFRASRDVTTQPYTGDQPAVIER